MILGLVMSLMKLLGALQGGLWINITPWRYVKIMQMPRLVCGFGQILTIFNSRSSRLQAGSLHSKEIWPEFALKMVMLTLKLSINRVSQVGLAGGWQFGINGQKLHENEKIGTFWSKQWGDMGGQANFLASVGNAPTLPPTKENPD